MTPPVAQIIEDFERLTDVEQREAVAEILARARHWDLPPLTDDQLAALADELFVALDREEAENA